MNIMYVYVYVLGQHDIPGVASLSDTLYIITENGQCNLLTNTQHNEMYACGLLYHVYHILSRLCHINANKGP